MCGYGRFGRKLAEDLRAVDAEVHPLPSGPTQAVVAEAFAVAAERWPVAGVPPNPGGATYIGNYELSNGETWPEIEEREADKLIDVVKVVDLSGDFRINDKEVFRQFYKLEHTADELQRAGQTRQRAGREYSSGSAGTTTTSAPASTRWPPRSTRSPTSRPCCSAWTCRTPPGSG